MGTAFRVAAAGVLAGTLFVAGTVRIPAWKHPEATPAPQVGWLSVRAAPGSMTETIAALQDRIREAPSDWRAAAALGQAYILHTRMTGDPTFYPRAEQALSRSLSIRPENIDALVGMGSLALGRHDFTEALAWGRRAVAANAHGAPGYGVVGDALVELGRYREAFRSFQRMADLRPGLPAYARASYARELQGDLAGAIGLMRMAEQAARSPEDAAWAAFELGELFWTQGRVRAAREAYRGASRLSPSYLPPRAGLARVSWAKGRTAEAIRRYRWVVSRYPAPEHVATLGDLYAAQGRQALAHEQFALVRAEQALFETNGVNVDLELALFYADHGRPQQAIRAARAAWAERKSIQAADALAWALHRAGKSREAAGYASRALRLGTRNPLFLFHAGMIERRLGREERAHGLLTEVLRTNPHFSILHARVARMALDRLESPG